MQTKDTQLSQNIIDKYNIPVPRYTSYPPANLFTSEYTSTSYQNDIRLSNNQGTRDLSFYIHIPFCRKICSYCACNKELFPSQRDGVETYINYVIKEFRLVCRHLDPTRKVSQIHFGGGSPTAIPIHFIEQILTEITSTFALTSDAEVAIECHPGYLGKEEWEHLLRMPFTRYSLGVQDFDKDVLKAVKRTPSKLPVEDIVDMIQAHGKRVNLDFIYGLPLQTPEQFGDTIRRAVGCKPDRLVTFSYAHVPWIHEVQKELEHLGLPDIETKKKMHEVATEIALSAGYEVIGLDHFVLKDDPLAVALRESTLHRNFQGYCTKTISGQVYALGVTGISQLENSYAQNLKTIPEYYAALDRGELPTHIGYSLSDDERLARDIINDLMCNYRTEPLLIAGRHGRQVHSLSDLNILRTHDLEEMVRDGLCRLDGGRLTMAPSAHLFVRNVAAAFDLHYTPLKTQGYSKPI